jgi:DNA-binding transcriptional MerR regulator
MVAAHKEEQKSAASDDVLFYTIEQVAQRTGLTKRTLRYYEEVGLLPSTGRTEGNYRRYSDADIQRLERIKSLLGFSLTEIRELLSAEEERDLIKQAYHQETDAEEKIAHLDHADEVIRGQLRLIEQNLHGLEQIRTSLLTKLERHERRRNELRQQES